MFSGWSYQSAIVRTIYSNLLNEWFFSFDESANVFEEKSVLLFALSFGGYLCEANKSDFREEKLLTDHR